MLKKFSELKVALVYDRVNTPFGGAENVLLSLHQIFPEAPLYTSVYDPSRASWAKVFKVIPSFLQKIPFAKKFHRLFVPFMPLAFESFDFSEYDVVISITSAEAKGVITKSHQLHICYLLTPTRYLWSHNHEYQQHWLTGDFRQEIFEYLKWWDTAAALRPDYYIPISQLVADRCQAYYHRQPSAVIYPPVEVAQLSHAKHLQKPAAAPDHYYLIVSRLVPYKRIDLAIQACQERGRNLIIIGNGPDLPRLQKLAKQNPTAKIIFLQSVQRMEVAAYYHHCQAFLMPAEEDFGITAIEAQAAGKPVVIYAKSGAAELIAHNKTGIHFFEHTVPSLSQAMQKLEAKIWDADAIQYQVAKYDVQYFEKNFLQTVKEVWSQFMELV